MNILITAPSLNPSRNVNGISTVVISIIDHNNAHSFFHYMLGRPDKPLPKLVWAMQLIKQLLQFPIALKKNKIDLVHQNLPFNPKGLMREYVISTFCRFMGIPVLLHVHGGVFLMNGISNPIFKHIANSLFRNSRQVVVLSEVEKDTLAKLHHFPSAKVLCNSIDVALYSANKNNLPIVKPTLLFLGRIHESKGIDDIIEAFRLLKAKMDFRFILCGVGPLKNQFVSACEQILGSDFEYEGIVSGGKKIEVISQSHLFLLPSRYGEGLPMALLETMAAGVVPVVTDDASMKYVVQHEINGIRVNKNDPKDLFEKLNRIITQPELFKTLSENAGKTIAKQYDIKNYIIRLNEIYLSALKQPK
jgi:glycosyltransferase involved in cell wall biosynthesis